MEVPIVGSDAVQWIEVNVPRTAPAQHDPCASPPRDAAGCFAIASSSEYIIWRVHKDLPNVLELMEWSFRREPPRYGLHITFQDSLFPFVSIFKHQMNNSAGNLLLYAITTSGFAYLIKLKSLAAYRSGEILHNNELIQLDLSKNLVCLDKITAVTVAAGILCVGGQNGSILCHQLGQLDQSTHDTSFELKDADGGLGRLWGLVSRGKTIGMIRSLVTSETHGKRLLFALHDDGNLRIWDLASRSRIFSHCLGSSDLSGFGPSMLYVGEKDANGTVSVLALYKSLSEANLEKIVLCKLDPFSTDIGGRSGQSVQQRSIPLEQGKVIDMRLSSDGLWVLKECGSALYELFHIDLELGRVCNYVLQESCIANEILQSSEFDVDNLILVHHFIYSSFKNEVPPSVSAIFLRRLMQSGVGQRRPLQEVMETRKKHLSDSDFRSLTVDGLRKEILTVIECEGIGDNQISLSYEWKSFCNIYMQSWCHNNVPYSLLFDSSTGGIGLIRRHSLSLNRSLCDIEQIVHGMPMVDGKISSLPSDWKHNIIDTEILDGILKCTGIISRYLGKAALAVFYEALLKPSSVTFQYLISRFLRILDVGYDFSVLKQRNSHLGVDFAREKEHKYHSHQRKFSLSILFSLQALRDKAGGWDRVLNVIEKFLTSIVPENFSYDKRSAARGILYSVNTTLLVQTISQVAEIQFETARDLLLLLGYVLKVKGQLNIEPANVSRIELQMIPRVQDIGTRSFLLYWMSTTSTEAPPVEDFSLQLSSLHIGDGKNENRTWEGMLGTGDLTLTGILIFGYPSSKNRASWMSTMQSPDELLSNAWKFTSWIFWGENGSQLESLSIRVIALSAILLQYGQYGVLENLFVTVDEHSDQQKLSRNTESMDGEWCARLHLLGFCLLARARLRLQENIKEKQIEEAIHCFFRAASGEEANQALQELTFQTGLQHSGPNTTAAWKLHYFEWVMQIFDQQNLSAGACQFARAALEQVDEALGVMDQLDDDTSLETASNIKGRLWANVFKFSMDLKQYSEAYCAIVSNPDEESKLICLRRFIIMLCEDKATQILCDRELPFVGLLERVERELVWKAECSDITAKPNPYKLLYAFHTYRHNWRRAAGYIYRYTVRMKEEGILRVHMELSFTLNERLQGLSAAINALHLVDPAYAWIDSVQESSNGLDRHSPTKRARKYIDVTSVITADETGKQNYAIDIEQLEKEYVLTLAHLELAAANVKHSSLGGNIQPADLVLLLIQSNLNDMAFTVIFKFWKDSSLKRELEMVFQIIAQKCCASKSTSLLLRDSLANVLLIPSSAREDEISIDRMGNNDFQTTRYINSKTKWNMLQLYLEKYLHIHPRLPVVVAETLLHADPQIKLPLWLVDMFKGGRKATAWGMAGQVSDPAALLRLYINYGRFSEATYLLLEYIEAWSSLRPADIVKRKKMSAVWFPYTSVERLYCILSEMINAGQMIEQCDKLQKLLHGALLGHLKQLKVDSDDAQSSAL
ncbi:nuclear pore complex protein NUP160 isoform X2 [Cryptomeria japonica]|uniref:nuclear pore complex protein NUP160 isoform X2 n=1 Tax=Cryptomeria japonica TaxID=3369 RepID=UPI0027DA4FDB|nr:nuclear pore complex protein NUP160 isoform X2 [Cryptomeria japonica]